MTSSNSDSSWLPRANLQILFEKVFFLQTCSLGLLRVINPYVDFKFNFFGLVGSISNGESPIGIIIPFGTDDWHMDTPRCEVLAHIVKNHNDNRIAISPYTKLVVAS